MSDSESWDDYVAYQGDTSAQDQLYADSSAAEEAGMSDVASELNADSVEAGADADTAWDAYNTPDESGAEADTTYTEVDTGDSYDDNAGGGEDMSQEYADYAGS